MTEYFLSFSKMASNNLSSTTATKNCNNFSLSWLLKLNKMSMCERYNIFNVFYATKLYQDQMSTVVIPNFYIASVFWWFFAILLILFVYFSSGNWMDTHWLFQQCYYLWTYWRCKLCSSLFVCICSMCPDSIYANVHFSFQSKVGIIAHLDEQCLLPGNVSYCFIFIFYLFYLSIFFIMYLIYFKLNCLM